MMLCVENENKTIETLSRAIVKHSESKTSREIAVSQLFEQIVADKSALLKLTNLSLVGTAITRSYQSDSLKKRPEDRAFVAASAFYCFSIEIQREMDRKDLRTGVEELKLRVMRLTVLSNFAREIYRFIDMIQDDCTPLCSEHLGRRTSVMKIVYYALLKNDLTNLDGFSLTGKLRRLYDTISHNKDIITPGSGRQYVSIIKKQVEAMCRQCIV